MKNMTLRIDEEVLAAVRRFAADRGTSVNALVRDYLARVARRQDRARQARERLRELSDTSPARIGEGGWTRDELHER